MYKIVETPETQVHRFSQPIGNPQPINQKDLNGAVIVLECAKCRTKTKLFAKFNKDSKSEQGTVPYPKNDIFACGQCHAISNIAASRLQVEAQTGKKIVF